MHSVFNFVSCSSSRVALHRVMPDFCGGNSSPGEGLGLGDGMRANNVCVVRDEKGHHTKQSERVRHNECGSEAV